MNKKNLTDIKKMSFEQALTELETIVSKLESGEVGLDESMEIYARGQQLKEYCSEKLAGARLQVEKINVENGGKISVSAMNPEE